MKFFFIHLMPYAELDLDYDKKHNSAWVTLPNTYYDPAKGPKLYNRYIDELVYADKLGFDGVCVNEHHQNAYGLMPIPGVIAGALARETKNVKIAVLGRALPLLTYPLSVAEEYAMLDNISGGRLIAGFVRGIGAEYHSTGVNPAESHDRFHEAHDLIMQAWTKPGPSRYEGKYYHFDYVNTWPRVVQQPHPPIWIPSQGSSETINWASHPTHKYVYLQTFSPADQLKRFMDMYRAKANEYGYEASPQQLGWATPVYVADTDEQAKREAKQHIEAFYQKFLRMPFEMLLPPGYLSLSSMQNVGQKARAAAAGDVTHTIDTVMERGMFICGSPDSVAQQLEHHQKTVGYGKLIAMMQFGTLPHDLTKRNMELFAQKVMPKIRHLGEDDRPIKVEAAE
jgi:alkanesulfonate monooxygenase SsuD/methylene tetrahydromethanopterin reductase-like flavin-dependent oxidoreductase (luciferase family)